MENPANAEAIETWNTILFDKFLRFQWVLTAGLGTHGDIAIERLAPGVGQRVLDVGCGFGDTTRQLAALVGPDGEAVGVDAAANFIDAARAEAAKHPGLRARFEVRDVESEPLGGPYPLAFARFGTMFFANPAAAMRNVRRSLTPDGRFVFVVWRQREDNEWLHAAELVVRELIDLPPEPEGITCGPGPFSMAGADTVSTILAHSGYREISFERLDVPICIGRTIDEAVEFALALGPAGEVIRLAGAEGERRRPEVVTAVRGVVSRFAGADGRVNAPSSTWIISARAA